MRICDYGCGREAKYQFKNGKVCCEKSFNKCPEMIKNKKPNSLPKRFENPNNELCSYGCGNIGKYKSISGNWCCEYNISKCPALIKKQNEARKFKLFENINNELCSYNCGQIAKYRKGSAFCCEDHHTKCQSYREYVKQNNPMYNKDVKKKHREKMKTLSGENNPLYTCEGALDRHISSQRSKEVRKRKSIATLKAVEKGIHPSHPDGIKELKDKYPFLFVVEEIIEVNNEIKARCKNHKCPNSKEQAGWFTPTIYQLHQRAYQLRDGNDNSYLYCCDKCKQECPLYGLQPSTYINLDDSIWYNSQEYLTWKNYVHELDNGLCVYCGNIGNIAHHILPQKTHPNLALDPENGITVCEECHFKYSHSDPLCTTGYLSKLVCQRITRIKEKDKK